MSRRSKPPNIVGCKPDEDVCVAHDQPLECRHGCGQALPHKCKDRERQDKILARFDAADEQGVVKK